MTEYKPNHDAKRILLNLAAFPPNEWQVIFHPDVQLTVEEWMELEGYVQLESDALLDPGMVAVAKLPEARPKGAVVVELSRGRGGAK